MAYNNLIGRKQKNKNFESESLISWNEFIFYVAIFLNNSIKIWNCSQIRAKVIYYLNNYTCKDKIYFCSYINHFTYISVLCKTKNSCHLT